MRTSAPRRASSSAIARPMPRPPPVIRASLPAKSRSLTDCHPSPLVASAGVADPSQAQDDTLEKVPVILREVRPKDPLLVIGVGVTDPSQVPMPCGHHRGMKMPPKRPPRDLVHRKLRMTSDLVSSQDAF